MFVVGTAFLVKGSEYDREVGGSGEEERRADIRVFETTNLIEWTT